MNRIYERKENIIMKGIIKDENSFFHLFIFLLFFWPLVINGQTKLTLSDAIHIATDSSLTAFKAKNLYLSGYWEYRTYIAQKKPTLSLDATVFDYNRSLTKRYNSETNTDEYRQQKSLFSYANASVIQNLPFSGGKLYFDSELGRLQSYGDNSYTQFSTVPFRIGINQPIFGYNQYKWLRKIEPIKYEKSKKEYIENIEYISMQMIDFYFDFLIAGNKITMALNNVANADSLYNFGKKRFEIVSLSQSDILNLRVNVLNARNQLANANKQLKLARYSFYSFMRISENFEFDLSTPYEVPSCDLTIDNVLDLAFANNSSTLSYKQQQIESESNLERARRESLLSATFTASYGLNQKNAELSKAYIDPLDQQRATVGITIPIIDWGQNKGKYNMAKKNHEVTLLTIEQAKADFKQQVVIAVTNYLMQNDVVKSTFETRIVAQQAYEITKQRFLIGKADVNSLNLALERQDNANINYLEALRSYWKYYYNIRKLTLFDFVHNKSLSEDFDEKLGIEN
jgi:hypothetical protein